MTKPVRLSERLQTAAGMVTLGGRVVDIGCDHGYLPIYLLEQGICTGAVAADVRTGPLSRAEVHIREHGLQEKIKTRLSDGLKAFKPGEGETLVLAGMGGPLMERILLDAPGTTASFREIIAQPQSDIPHFRRFAARTGLAVCEEKMLTEDGKFYVVMRLVPSADFPRDRIAGGKTTDGGRNLSSPDFPQDKITGGATDGSRNPDTPEEEAYTLEERFGKMLLESGCPVLEAFLQREKRILAQIESSLREGAESGRASERLAQVRRELAQTEEAMKMLRK